MMYPKFELFINLSIFLKFWVEKENFKEVVKQNWLADVEDVFVQLKIKKKKTKIELSK